MSIKKYLLIFLVLLPVNFSFTQGVNIIVSNFDKEKAALFSISGEKLIFIDSISSSNNNFTFNLNHSGFYKVAFDNNNYFNFIYDNSDVNIETDAKICAEQTNFINSEENDILNKFFKLNKDFKEKTELLRFITFNYPKKDSYYQQTIDELEKVQDNYLHFVNVTSQTDPKSFVARYIQSSQLPVISNYTSSDDYLLELKTHSLDKINFNDEELIYSDAFTNKTIEYLSYYRNQQLPLPLLEKEFSTAIDSILIKARINEIVYKHIVEYLLDGFKKFGFDNVINYIVDNYVIKDDICLDSKLQTTLERRIQQSKYFKPGTILPEIIFEDSTKSEISLSNITSDKTLIIFYASWCPHCKTLLPQLFDIYKNQKEKVFEVIAVSIDTSEIDLKNFLDEYKFNWLNVADLNGWDGQTVKDYSIYATPTMFLADKNKKLIKIITSIEELKTLM